jgi:hypothetical protein
MRDYNTASSKATTTGIKIADYFGVFQVDFVKE